MKQCRRSAAGGARLLVVGAAAALTLLVAAPHPPMAPRELPHWLATASADEALAGAAALAAWACIGVLVVAAALVSLSRLPGLTGVLVGRLTACVVPVTLRRTLEAGLGISIAATPVVAPVAVPEGAPAPADPAPPAPTLSPPLLC